MIYNYIRLTDNLRQIDTKFSIKMSPILLKNANFPKFVQFQFLHFDAEHGKSIAVLDKISVPGKHCLELYCAVHVFAELIQLISD